MSDHARKFLPFYIKKETRRKSSYSIRARKVIFFDGQEINEIIWSQLAAQYILVIINKMSDLND